MKLVYPAVGWKCTRCGDCCRDIPGHKRKILLCAGDIKAIKAADFCRKLARPKGSYTHIVRKIKGECVFLKKNRCKIYKNRPLICRFFPFELQTKDGWSVFTYSKKCRGIRKHGQVSMKKFVELLKLAEKQLT